MLFRSERDYEGGELAVDVDISIHALREERDVATIHQEVLPELISIHALREERDPPRGDLFGRDAIFQSTRSARSATLVLVGGHPLGIDFNPRAPRGARLLSSLGVIHWVQISIHALREERDPDRMQKNKSRLYFNPRAPRGARLLFSINIL